MKRLPLIAMVSLGVLVLSGCKSKNSDSAYTEIGEMRVFEEPFRRADWEKQRMGAPTGDVSAPSPLAAAPGTGGGFAQASMPERPVVRRHVKVGELDVNE
jgi:hypothetical protein